MNSVVQGLGDLRAWWKTRALLSATKGSWQTKSFRPSTVGPAIDKLAASSTNDRRTDDGFSTAEINCLEYSNRCRSLELRRSQCQLSTAVRLAFLLLPDIKTIQTEDMSPAR
jgi:hypothetical protein